MEPTAHFNLIIVLTLILFGLLCTHKEIGSKRSKGSKGNKGNKQPTNKKESTMKVCNSIVSLLNETKAAAGHERYLELHVKGATMLNNEVPNELKGKFLGLVVPAMIDLYKEAGITALQLLPVMNDNKASYWHYDTVDWFTLNPEFGTEAEFKMMVNELHKNGIKVILDTVFHRKVSPAVGTVVDSRMNNVVMGDTNYTGCGSEVKVNHPDTIEVVKMALDNLFNNLGVDGLRLDLAGTLGRMEDGSFWNESPFFTELGKYVEAGKIVTGEAYDLCGWFVDHMPKWFRDINTMFRDHVRNGGKYNTEWLHTNQVNMIWVHDGFTAMDYVSYSTKYNHVNGEHNRDGRDNEKCYNFGAEGVTNNEMVNNNRLSHLHWCFKQLIKANLKSDIVIQLGDLCLNTQYGNNNSYKVDGVISWVKWDSQYN